MQLVPLDLQFIVAIVTFHAAHAYNSSSTVPVLSLGVDFPQFFSISHLLLALGLPFMLCFKESFFSCSCVSASSIQLSPVTWQFLACGGEQVYTLFFSLRVSLTKAVYLWASGLWSSQGSAPRWGGSSEPISDSCSSPKGEFVLFSLCSSPRCRGKLFHCSK